MVMYIGNVLLKPYALPKKPAVAARVVPRNNNVLITNVALQRKSAQTNVARKVKHASKIMNALVV